MLVTEFIDGIKIGELEELQMEKYDLKDINTKLFLAFGEQIFQSGFVHADPHPGNGNFDMYLLVLCVAVNVINSVLNLVFSHLDTSIF